MSSTGRLITKGPVDPKPEALFLELRRRVAFFLNNDEVNAVEAAFPGVLTDLTKQRNYNLKTVIKWLETNKVGTVLSTTEHVLHKMAVNAPFRNIYADLTLNSQGWGPFFA